MSHIAARRLVVIGVASAVALGWWNGAGGRLRAQQPAARVFLSAVDRIGSPVTNILPSEISLVLDGMACPSTKVEPVNWPMKLQVLVDNGEAVTNSLPSLREGLRAFFAEIPDGVEMSLVTYAPQPRFVVRSTPDRQQLVKGIDLVAPASGSAGKFLDAVGEAVDRVNKEKGNYFHTIMVITTNGPEGSNGNLDGVVQRIQRQLDDRAATVHVAMVAISGMQSVGRVQGAVQTQMGTAITKMSGGRYENVAVATRLPTLLPEFGKQIARSDRLQRNQYRLSCDTSPSKSPKFSVRTSNPNIADILLSFDGLVP